MKSTVKLVEVGPRDGLQNEAQNVATATKLELIDKLVESGLRDIEIAAFVSPKWVPNMADHAQIVQQVKTHPGVNYSVLTPNIRGFNAALKLGVKEMAVFTAASESFSQRNINCSIEESIERFVPILAEAKAVGVKVRGYISCVVGCPYEGDIKPEKVAKVASKLFQMGCYELSLGDTIGIGSPLQVREMLKAVFQCVPIEKLAGHFHDTYGMALANVQAAYELGLRVFDSSVGGLGGCPYAEGASGNVATEDVVNLFHRQGVQTGVNLESLVVTSAWICEELGHATHSKVAKALLSRR